jgi:DNA-binding response OmpR family regulator
VSRLLVVEDEQHLAEGLRFNLVAERHDVEVVDTGEAALALLAASPARFDLVILDVMLPGINGFDVVSTLRRAGQFVPVLMLTARGRPEDVLLGFQSGADDYLPKPFELPILIVRVRGLLRRREWFQRGLEPQLPAPSVSSRFTFCGRVIDFEQLEVRVGDKTMPLTLMEASLLRYLVEHEDRPVSRKMILENVWGVREDTDTRAIDNFIVRLRRYLEDEPGRPRHLRTVRGVGYRFVANPD